MQRFVLLVSLLALLAPASAGQTTLYTFPPTGKFGSALGAAGDVDADGYPDFVVGNPTDSTAGAGEGAFFVYSGKDAALLHSFGAGLGYFAWGRVVDGAGDTNGDGYADVVGGAGYAFVHSGLDGSVLHPLVTPGITSVAGAGDVDQDGFDDVIVGSPGAGISDRARVHSGLDGTVIREWTGCTTSGGFGAAVDGAGDVNADGTPDVVVLSIEGDLPGCPEAARVFSGLDGSLLHVFPTSVSVSYGYQGVRGAGDVDADGHADLIVGKTITNQCSGSLPGEAKVYSGATGAMLHTFVGDPGCTWLGHSVSGAGDVDEDGFDDLLVGAIGFQVGSGYAEVYSGQHGNLLYRAKGTGLQFGYATDAMGDLNQDGRLDFGVGESAGTATIFSACTGTFTPHGDGCPAASGASPKLAGWGCAMAGESVNLTLSNAFPGVPGFLALGAAQASIPLASSCSLLVSPLVAVIPTGALAGTGIAGGKVTISLGVPTTAAGAVANVQGFVVDLDLLHLFAASNGVEIQVQ